MLSINRTDIMQESDKLRNHKISKRKAALEKSMDNQSYEHLTIEDNGMKITLEFPLFTRDDSAISEVKNILAEILNDYLENES